MRVITANKPVMDFMYPEIIVDTTYEPGIHEDELEKILEEEEKERLVRENSQVIDEESRYDDQNQDDSGVKTLEDTKDEEEKFNPVPVPVKRIKVKRTTRTAPIPKRIAPIGTSGF